MATVVLHLTDRVLGTWRMRIPFLWAENLHGVQKL
jgi:hypothetical protein